MGQVQPETLPKTDEGNIDETESGFVLDMIEDIKDPTGTSNDNENKDPVTKEDKGNDVIVPNNNEKDEIEGNNTDIEVDNISVDLTTIILSVVFTSTSLSPSIFSPKNSIHHKNLYNEYVDI
jgi:hypothetical protein